MEGEQPVRGSTGIDTVQMHAAGINVGGGDAGSLWCMRAAVPSTEEW